MQTNALEFLENLLLLIIIHKVCSLYLILGIDPEQ